MKIRDIGDLANFIAAVGVVEELHGAATLPGEPHAAIEWVKDLERDVPAPERHARGQQTLAAAGEHGLEIGVAEGLVLVHLTTHGGVVCMGRWGVAHRCRSPFAARANLSALVKLHIGKVARTDVQGSCGWHQEGWY